MAQANLTIDRFLEFRFVPSVMDGVVLGNREVSKIEGGLAYAPVVLKYPVGKRFVVVRVLPRVADKDVNLMSAQNLPPSAVRTI